MKRKSPHTRPTITAPRSASPSGATAQAYPTVHGVASPLLERARRLAEKLMITGAAVGLAAAASGCKPPSCQPTRFAEVRFHGANAFDDLTRSDFAYAKDEAGIGLGIVPHPMSMVAGEMTAVMPTTPVTPPPSSEP